LEDLVHYGLEGSRAVGHSKEHHEGFKEAAIGMKGHFPFISRLDAYIIKAPADIEFCEVFSSAELRNKFGDERERISVLDGYGIQHVIVLDQPERTIFLLNEEHGSCDGEFGRLDLSGMEVFLQESVQLLLFQWEQEIDL